jgi:hypothetical protein
MRRRKVAHERIPRVDCLEKRLTAPDQQLIRLCWICGVCLVHQTACDWNRRAIQNTLQLSRLIQLPISGRHQQAPWILGRVTHAIDRAPATRCIRRIIQTQLGSVRPVPALALTIVNAVRHPLCSIRLKIDNVS